MNPTDQARQIGVVQAYVTQTKVYGSAANPGDATVLVTTGQLAAGYYDIFFGFTANCALGAGNLDLRWRNATDTATALALPVFAATQFAYFGQFLGVYVVQNERLQWYVNTGFTGVVGGFILAVRRA